MVIRAGTDMLECVARRDILKFFADELWPVDCYYGVWYAVLHPSMLDGGDDQLRKSLSSIFFP